MSELCYLADCLLRGVLLSELHSNVLLWHGPLDLQNPNFSVDLFVNKETCIFDNKSEQNFGHSLDIYAQPHVTVGEPSKYVLLFQWGELE